MLVTNNYPAVQMSAKAKIQNKNVRQNNQQTFGGSHRAEQSANAGKLVIALLLAAGVGISALTSGTPKKSPVAKNNITSVVNDTAKTVTKNIHH